MKTEIKKVLSALTAIIMCTAALCSCKSDKKPDKLEEPAVEEPVFIEGSVETANRINVPVTVNRDAEPPLKVNKLEGIDFLEIMPEEIKAAGEAAGAESYQYSIMDTCVVSNKVFAHIGYVCVVFVYDGTDGQLLYSDTRNIGTAIFEIDYETGTSKSVYMTIDDENEGLSDNIGTNADIKQDFLINGYFDDMDASDKYLYIDVSHIEDDYYIETIAIDPVTYEQKSVYKSMNDPMWYNTEVDGNQLIIKENIYKYSEEQDGGFSITYLDSYVTYYNEDTGETTEPELIASSPEASLESTDIQYGKAVTVTYSDEEYNGITSVEREGVYHIDMSEMNTAHSYIGLCTDTDILWTTSDSGFSGGKTYLYDYDVQTNTIYELDISSYSIGTGNMYPAGEGYIAMSNSLVYYLIPDMGMIFVLTPMGNYHSNFINGSIFSFCGSENPSGYSEGNDNFYWIDLTENEESEEE